MVDRDESESDSHGKETSRHAPSSAYEELSSAYFVHTLHVDKCHDEVGSSNYEADSDWVRESDKGEKSRGVVHKSIESGCDLSGIMSDGRKIRNIPAHLCNNSKATSNKKSTEVRSLVKTLDL